MAVKLKDDTAKMEKYPMKWLNGIQVFILCAKFYFREQVSVAYNFRGNMKLGWKQVSQLKNFIQHFFI